MASGDDLADTTGGNDPDLPSELSRRLREAHRRLVALPGDREDKARAARRLIAITNAAKHDVPTAARRLDAFLADIDAGRYGL